MTKLEGQDHSTANVEGSIGAASPFSPVPNNDQPAPKMNTSAKMPSRALWRRCFLARRRGIVSIAQSPGILRGDVSLPGPSKVRAFTRSLYRNPPMETMDFIGIHVKPLYIVVARTPLRVRSLPHPSLLLRNPRHPNHRRPNRLRRSLRHRRMKDHPRTCSRCPEPRRATAQ